jgi:hypothetical protein
MSGKDNSRDLPENREVLPLKRKYSRPRLVLFGSASELTAGGGGTKTDGGGSMPHTPSDRRLKENIVSIGTHSLGIGLYLYDYKSEFQPECGVGRQFGVMADEVEAVMPSAVVKGDDGYFMVNYRMLGIRQRT